MKAGLSISLVLHGLAIGFGLFSLSAPRAYDVADVESLPVDLVSVEEFAEIMRGDRKAPAAENPAPTPTKRPDTVEDAENIGDNRADLANAPTPEPGPRPVEKSAKADPAPVPAREDEPDLEARAEPAPVPATEVLPEPEPKADLAPDPEPSPAIAERTETETVELPDTAPVPQPRPSRPEAQTAKAPERKDSETPERVSASRPQPEETEFDADEVAALIDRAKASGGGARRSEREAALGNRQDSEAKRLSQGELDALRSQLESCWNPPVGAVGSSEFSASVKFQVDAGRRLSGTPAIIQSSGNRQFDDSVVRAVLICNDRGFELPEGKQAVWADIIVNFDPSDMY